MEARLHDGTVLNFPDGTDTAVVQSTVKRYLGGGFQPTAPALEKPSGAVVPGLPGDVHNDLSPNPPESQRKFTTPSGQLESRETAAAVSGVPTTVEPGKLHSEDLIAAGREGMSHVGSFVSQEKDSATRLGKIGLGLNPDADYKTGTNWLARRDFQAADTVGEKQKALKKYFPDAQVTTDSKGNFLIQRPGDTQPMEVMGDNFWGNLAAGVAAHPLETAGGIAGSIMTGGAGILPAAAMAGTGAAVGYGADELIKKARGLSDKTPSELSRGLTGAEASSAFGEAGARTLVRAAKGGLPEIITGADAETKEMINKLVSLQGSPEFRTAAPSMKASQWKVALGENLAGKFSAPNTRPVLLAMQEYLERQGDKSTAAAVKQVLNQEFSSNATEAALTRPVQASIDAATNEAAAATTGARRSAQTSLKDVMGRLAQPAADLAGAVRGDILDARKALSTQYQQAYGKISEGLGDKAIIQTHGVAKAASDVLKALPKSEIEEIPGAATADLVGFGSAGGPGPGATTGGKPILTSSQFLKDLGDLAKLDDPKSLKEMAAIRTKLMDMAEIRDLLPATEKHQYQELVKSVSEAIETASKSLPNDVDRKLVKQWLTTNSEYAKDIAKFDDADLVRLTKQAGKSGSLDVEDLARFTSRKPSDVARIYRMLKPETQQKLARAVMDEMVGTATSKDLTGISGKTLLAQVQQRQPVMKQIFGKDADAILAAAKKLAAAGGDLPTTKLTPGGFRTIVERAAKAADLRNVYLGKNYLEALADEARTLGPEAAAARKTELSDAAVMSYLHTPQAERAGGKSAAAYLIEPGNNARLEAALRYYAKARKDAARLPGGTSPTSTPPEIELLKSAFRKRILGGMLNTGEGVTEKTAMSGVGIRKALTEFTDFQKRSLLNPGEVEDLQALSRFVDFAFPKGAHQMSAELAGGMVKSGIPYKARAIARFGSAIFSAYILTRPQTIKWLVNGIEGDSAAFKMFENGLKTYAQTRTEGRYTGGDAQ